MPGEAGSLPGRLLTEALEASANGIVITDKSGTIQWVNPAFTAMTGYPPEAALGNNPRFLKSGKHPDTFYAGMWRTIMAGIPWRGELVNRRSDGSLYTEEMTITPIQETGGEITHFIAIKQDVSARKQVEEELERSRSRLELGLEATNQGLWDWDLVTNAAYFSPQYYRMLGYDPGELEPSYRGWRSIVHPDDYARAVKEINDYLEGRRKVFDLEFRARRKSGEYARILSRGEVVSRNQSGRPVRMIGTHTDITDRARLERQVRQAQKMDAISVLTAGIAHDFNNILTVVNGYAELIASKVTSLETAREYADTVGAAGREAFGLVRQLMAFSRLQVREPALLNINDVVIETEEMYRRILPGNIEFVTRLDRAVGPIFADPSQIHQIVMNLIVNARDAMADGGRLLMETRNIDSNASGFELHWSMPPGRYTVLSVTDTGIGMDEKTQERMFEPFFTTKPKGAGTGLGLSTVYGLTKQNSGWIWVNSEKGKGARFNLCFPCVEGELPARTDPSTSSVEGGDETVLLVEDDSDVRGFLIRALESYGYEVIEAAGATEAWAALENAARGIDLLVTDLVLPGASGREMADRIRVLRPDIRVLLISGYGNNVIAGEEVLDGGIEFLQKPFTGDVLAARVREVLRKRGTPQ